MSPATVLAVKRAAVEVLKNSKMRLANRAGGAGIQIRWRIDAGGPVPRLVIELQHCIREPFPAGLLPFIYRAPIEDVEPDDGRRHYGAFTAGYWMRAVGGDAYVWRAETDGEGRRWFGTALDIPLLTLAPDPVDP